MSTKGREREPCWSEEEDATLRRVWPASSAAEISGALPGRTKKAISYRAELIGVRCISRPKPNNAKSPVIERDGVKGKVCLTCSEWKPLYKFGHNRGAPGVGYRKPRCSRCESATNYLKYPETVRRGSEKYRYANPEKLYLGCMRGRAMKMGAPCEPISVEDINQLKALHRGLCAYCRRGSGDTLDHVLPLSRGGAHRLANLLPACFRCNHSKKNKTVEEWAASSVPHNPFRDPGEYTTWQAYLRGISRA